MAKKPIKKQIKTFLYRFGILAFLLIPLLLTLLTPAFGAEKTDYGPELTSHTFMIDEEGKPYKESFQDPHNTIHGRMSALFRNADEGVLPLEQEPKADVIYVAYLNSKSWDGKFSYLKYENASNPGTDGYTTGSYAKDGAFIGVFNDRYRVQQSGILMDFDKRDVQLVEYDKANISHYYIKGDYLYHKIYYKTTSSSAHRVGLALDFMKEGVKYYSYDGHYFYDSYPTLVQDVKNNSHQKSLNPAKPHYNYFQFLSHRTTTSLTAQDLDGIVNEKVGDSESRMKTSGQFFLNIQNSHGVNALHMFGLAGNESSWGTSRIAIDKNNLFGHGAVDSNPYYGAHGYESPELSIKYHAESFVNSYLRPTNWKYNGPHLGDKGSGMNVRYASDPYWGEKAASIAYYNKVCMKDYGKTRIGIIEGLSKDKNVYKEPTTDSPIVYTIGQKSKPVTLNHPIVILDEMKDSHQKLWYKIRSDTALNNDRTAILKDNLYDFNRDYVYIPADGIKILYNGKDVIPPYNRGDVNNNKKIDAADYLMVMDTILGKYKMTALQKEAGDVNKNKKIDAADYLMIMDSILGKIKL